MSDASRIRAIQSLEADLGLIQSPITQAERDAKMASVRKD